MQKTVGLMELQQHLQPIPFETFRRFQVPQAITFDEAMILANSPLPQPGPLEIPYDGIWNGYNGVYFSVNKNRVSAVSFKISIGTCTNLVFPFGYSNSVPINGNSFSISMSSAGQRATFSGQFNSKLHCK